MSFSDEEEELLAFLRSEQESYYRGDFAAFAQHWHHGPEVRRMTSGPRVGTRIHVGWDEFRARFEEGFRQFPQDFDARKYLHWENIQILMSGDIAWITYDQIADQLPPGMHAEPLTHEIKITHRIDGSWKLVSLTAIVPEIDRRDRPRIELDADGGVISVNALARERLAAHPGLTVSGNRPRARNRAYDAGLQTAIRRTRKHLSTNLRRGFLDEQVLVVPLGEDENGHPDFCCVTPEQERVLISFDDTYLLRGRLERARVTFALSPAQLKLAELLASGHDQASAARELGISVNTVRTQVRRMFEKTSTHNQSSLVSQLLSVPGPD